MFVTGLFLFLAIDVCHRTVFVSGNRCLNQDWFCFRQLMFDTGLFLFLAIDVCHRTVFVSGNRCLNQDCFCVRQ